MTLLTFIGLVACLFILVIGGLTTLTEQGYHFDLRGARGRRKLKDGRNGGRRNQDLHVAK
jgi:hypothetical protein